MNVRSLALGLAIGFLAGWLVFGTGTSLPEGPPVREPRPERTASATEPPPPADPAPAPGDERTVADAPRAPEVPPEERARDAIARLDFALAVGDERAYEAALRDLGNADHDLARKRLLALIEDERLPEMRGVLVVEAFEGSDLPGIAAAARLRYERNLLAGVTSWVATDGWFDLVARHGEAADLDWLLRQTRHRGQAMRALARSPSPVAADRFELLFRSGLVSTSLLDEFRSHSPGRAFEILHEMIRSGDWRPVNAGYGELLREYGTCAPEDRLAEVRATLLAVEEPQKRIAVVYAVEALRRRGLDVSGFEPAIRAPVEVLEGPDSPLKGTARYSVEYNEVAWSERSAKALEAAGFTSEAAQIRAKLRSPFRGR